MFHICSCVTWEVGSGGCTSTETSSHHIVIIKQKTDGSQKLAKLVMDTNFVNLLCVVKFTGNTDDRTTGLNRVCIVNYDDSE
jgi:hypothetical protein